MFDGQRQDSGAAVGLALSRPPVLVTGSPRSGSTWVGNVLALDRNAGYVHEPFNNHCPPGICRARADHDFTYLTAENEGALPRAAARHARLALQHRRRVPHPAHPARAGAARPRLRLFRDHAPARRPGDPEGPAGDLLGRLARQPLRLPGWWSIIRHPAAFVASMRAAGFVDAFQRLREPAAADAGPARALRRGDRRRRPPDARRDRGAHPALADPAPPHRPLAWPSIPTGSSCATRISSRDPVTGFGDLFARLGLDFSRRGAHQPRPVHHRARRARPAVAVRQQAADHARQPGEHARTSASGWTPEEIDRIRRDAAPLWQRFYGDATGSSARGTFHPRAARARAKARKAASGLRSRGRPLRTQKRRHSASRQ